MNVNAKDEFLRHVDGRKIKRAVIFKWVSGEPVQLILFAGYSYEDYANFVKELNYLYNRNQATPFKGFIWYMDGSWSERRYDMRGVGEWCLVEPPDFFDMI